MRVASGRSLNRRLTSAIVLTSAASLLLACAAIVVYDRSTFAEAMTGRAETLAEVVGLNSATALGFLDPESAGQTLAALSAADAVVAAVLYDAQGEEFARYDRDAGRASVPLLAAGSSLSRAGTMDLARPVVFDGSQIGTLVIRWDTAEIDARTLSFVGIVGALLVAGVALGGLLAARLGGQIARPLAELVERSKAISEGDLSARVQVSTQDEIGELATTFNDMTDRLGELADQVNDGTRDVGEVSERLQESASSLGHQAERQTVAIQHTSESILQAGESIRRVHEDVDELSEAMRDTSSSIAEMQASTSEVAAHMEHLASSIETTSSAVDQVATGTDEVVEGLATLNRATDESVSSLGQLRRSVELVTGNARTSHDLSEDTSREATRGLHAVEETISAMAQISESFAKLDATISSLATKSTSIDEVIKVIRNIADATGMLSLNASIIAAQAGEHGKAFSVVADEVSELARSTHRSTVQIAELIRAVQEDTAAAVSAAEEGAARVELGVQRSNVAGEVLKLIDEKSQLSAARVHEILEASSHQVADLERVDGATASANRIAEQFERAARDQQRATSEIVAAIGSIRDLSQGVRRSMSEQERGAALITRAIGDVTARVDRIAESARAQTKSAESIEQSLGVFQDVTNETTTRVAALDEMVSMLSKRAARLETAVRRFRTREKDRGPEAGAPPRIPRSPAPDAPLVGSGVRGGDVHAS